MHRFGEVQAHRTSSNLLELHPHRDSKVGPLVQVGLVDRSIGPGRASGQGPLVQVGLVDKVHLSRSD